jgi:hypothetical protein
MKSWGRRTGVRNNRINDSGNYLHVDTQYCVQEDQSPKAKRTKSNFNARVLSLLQQHHVLILHVVRPNMASVPREDSSKPLRTDDLQHFTLNVLLLRVYQ